MYDAQTDDFIGFTNMGSRSNNKVDDLAIHALTVYAKSFCGTPGLKFPLAYFATVTAKAPQLASIVWESIGPLEVNGPMACKKYGIASLCS